VIEKLDFNNVLEVQAIREKIKDDKNLIVIFDLMIQTINQVITKRDIT
tara:strand:+ start:2287 stop:2430 length:144 start_codon:yes stop_codon:yes gene_type:complete